MKLDPNKIWIMQVPVISSAHIQESTNDWLSQVVDTADAPMEMWDLDQGWMIFTPEWQYLDDPMYASVPLDLKNCMRWCRQQDGDWLRIDADGSHIEDLPTYDW